MPANGLRGTRNTMRNAREIERIQASGGADKPIIVSEEL